MSGYRGRLIFPVFARIYPIDTLGISEVVDGGYDEDFREPIRVADGTQTGAPSRRESDPVDVLCQVEDETWEAQAVGPTGDDPRTTLRLVFHAADLECLGYVDSATGDLTFPRKGDRLESLRSTRTGAVIQTLPGEGLYCVEAQPRSYGLTGGTRNLLVATFIERGKAPSST